MYLNVETFLYFILSIRFFLHSYNPSTRTLTLKFFDSRKIPYSKYAYNVTENSENDFK